MAEKTVIPGRSFEKPAHVPDDLVYPVQIAAGDDFLAAPHDYMAKLHDWCPPIFYRMDPFAGGTWTVIKHPIVLEVLRDPAKFSTRGATPFPRDPDDYFYFIPLEIDPPHHRKYRNIVDPLFSPKGVATLENDMRVLANQLIDEFIEDGECDFSTQFGRPFPVTIFLKLMGLPVDMTDTFVQWAVDLLHSGSREVMADTMGKISAYLKLAIAEKKANPDEGVMSRIAHAAPDGVPLTDAEIFGFNMFLFIGGLDTVFATLNNIWLWLAENPERCKEIIDRPEDINKVVEELLRVHSVTFSGRTVEEDMVFHGITMKKGDKINSLLPVANFDPDVFPNPREVNFDRPRQTILAFTVGVHSCMGAHLARQEVKVALQEWLKRMPEFTTKEGYKPVYKQGGVIGPHYLPLVWK